MSAKTRTVIITGSSSGIGLAIARDFLQEGANVVLNGRDPGKLDAVASELGAPDRVAAVAGNIGERETGEALAQTAVERFGRIDVLVNNAGYGSYGAIEDVPMDEARRQVEVNLFGLARMIQLVLPGMRTRGGGTIVNVTSMGGKITTPFGGWYHASKFAVEGLSDALRGEVAPFGVDVVVIEPGAIATEWGGIALDTARAASGEGAYADRVTAVAASMDGPMAQRNSDPDVVARAIEKAVTARRPRTRYAVGFMAKPALIARRVLPDRAMDWIQTRMLG